MEKSGELVSGLVVARGPKRCRYSEEAKRSLAQLAARPGISVARVVFPYCVDSPGLVLQFCFNQGTIKKLGVKRLLLQARCVECNDAKRHSAGPF